MDKKEIIRTIYLYLFSTIGLILIVIGSVTLVDLGLKSFIFKSADEIIVYPDYPGMRPIAVSEISTATPTAEELQRYKDEQTKAQEQQRQNDKARRASSAIAMIIVGLPLFSYHWKTLNGSRQSA